MELKYKNTFFNLDTILDEKTFAFPNFQRGFAWKLNKKQNFIKTLLKGEPFGTILVYEEGNNTYLIDGLQRISTIREFSNDKYLYLTEDIIDDGLISDTYKVLKGIFKENKNELEIVKSRFDLDNTKKVVFNKIQKNKGDLDLSFNDIKKYFKLLNIKSKDLNVLSSCIKSIIRSITQKTNISNLKVYAIVYTGDNSRLPDIFYNLNVGGTAPSKYEVLAPLWNKLTYVVKDDEIIESVYNRYKLLKNSSQLKVMINKADLVKNGITLFEYCYAIGKILYSEKYGFTSFLGKSNDNIEPLGFSIVALLLGLNENEANKIGKKLERVSPKFLVDLKKVIIDGFDNINKGLKDWLKSERVTKKYPESFNTLNSNYMIYHMFMSYVSKNYIIDLSNQSIEKIHKASVDNWNAGFILNLHLHYFYDFITDFWAKHRQVKDLTACIKNEDTLFKYAYKISDDFWDKALKDLKSEQLTYFSSNFNKKSRLFLEYLIKFKIKEEPSLRKKYFTSHTTKELKTIDIEHIVPVSRIDERGLLKSIPVYSLGNACYLTSDVNEGKREKTMYEYANERPGYKVDSVFTSFVNYPTEDQFNKFLYDTPADFKDKYIAFLSNRLDELNSDFMKYMI